MAALEAGSIAPEISLPTSKGNKFSLSEARRQGLVVVAFYKVSCPTCQLTFPYLDKLQKAYGDTGFTFVGVSQDSPEDTKAFTERFGVTFVQAFDAGKKYVASNAYGLTNVPSIFVISPEGKVEMTSVGWSRQDFEALNSWLAKASGKPVAAVIQPHDPVTDFKPG